MSHVDNLNTVTIPMSMARGILTLLDHSIELMQKEELTPKKQDLISTLNQARQHVHLAIGSINKHLNVGTDLASTLAESHIAGQLKKIGVDTDNVKLSQESWELLESVPPKIHAAILNSLMADSIVREGGGVEKMTSATPYDCDITKLDPDEFSLKMNLFKKTDSLADLLRLAKSLAADKQL